MGLKKKKESDAQLHITKISPFILVSKSKVNIDVENLFGIAA